ncbi:aminoglycoside phosphotransferase family protein [Oceanobacillus sp. CAU 1775]
MNLNHLIAKGNTATIYLSDNKIIKVFNDYLPDTESEYEANKQRYAYASGLPVPKVFDVTKIDGEQAIIMEYIQGETLGELMLKDKEKAEYYLDISVDVQMKIHRIMPNTREMESMVEKLSRQIENSTQLDYKQKANLINKMNSMSYDYRLCHGDFHLFNLIRTDNHVVIIDWVDASAGDIRADVYRTYLLYSQISFELAETYLRIYCEKSGLSKSDVFQWAPIIAGARLAEAVSTESSERLLKIVNDFA